ncbi:MAG: hypothetical protein RLZ49_418 [Actinomycetota bacterium]|jgi:hypothetical protein
MTQRGRHRAPGRHARPKNHNVPLRSAIVASAAVLLTGGITAANSSEQAPPYIDVAALVIESTVSYDIKDHSLTSSVVTEPVKLGFETSVTEDATIAAGTEIIKQAGKTGLAEITYQVKLLDGNEVSRVEVSRVVNSEPTTEFVIRGTGDPTDIAVALATAEGKTGTKSGNKEFAKLWINQEFGWGDKQFSCLETLWFRESNWNHKATNPVTGAYGIPQSLPGRKMASIADDWKTNPVTQIKWGAEYIEDRYDTPCEALDFFYDRNWY